MFYEEQRYVRDLIVKRLAASVYAATAALIDVETDEGWQVAPRDADGFLALWHEWDCPNIRIRDAEGAYWVKLVGENGFDVISDYGVSAERFLKPTLDWIELAREGKA